MASYSTSDTNVAAFLVVKGYRMVKMVRSHTSETVTFEFDEKGNPVDELVKAYLYERGEVPAREFAETSRELRKQVAQMIKEGTFEKS